MSLIPYEHFAGVFVQANVEVAANCLLRWGQEIGRFSSFEKRRLPFEQMWRLLDERKCPTDRAVLVPHVNGWTAFFDNNRYEHISSSIGYNLCRLLRAQVLEFYYDSRPSEHQGSGQFRALLPSGASEPVERAVLLYHEGSWQFVQQGEPLPFERVDVYTKPKVRDRLTLDLLRTYAASVGIRISDPLAYGEEIALLYEKDTVEDVAESLRKIQEVFGGKLRLISPIPRESKRGRDS